MSLSLTFQKFYFNATGYSFTNMGRLFLRMFVGLMLAQFGVRQLMNPELVGAIPFLEFGLSKWLVIVTELLCSFFIMIGLFMRVMTVPPFLLMIAASHKITVIFGGLGATPVSSLCIPFLFMGIFMFLMLVGPGKISIDYFYSLYLISRHHNGKEEDLEEV